MNKLYPRAAKTLFNASRLKRRFTFFTGDDKYMSIVISVWLTDAHVKIHCGEGYECVGVLTPDGVYTATRIMPTVTQLMIDLDSFGEEYLFFYGRTRFRCACCGRLLRRETEVTAGVHERCSRRYSL